jgi:hypothetical protein
MEDEATVRVAFCIAVVVTIAMVLVILTLAELKGLIDGFIKHDDSRED